MKKAYLTIDDGPSVNRREKVDILNKYGIQAVWFSMGIDIENHWEDALYTIQQGHIIGNHSYNHPNFSEITPEQCYEEIKETDKLIEKLYRESKVQRPAKYFRFPFGNEGVNHPFYEFNYTAEERERVDSIQKVLKDMGYEKFKFGNISYQYYFKKDETGNIDWLWTYDAMEWCVFQEKPLYGVTCLDDVLEMMDMDLPERWMGLNSQKSDEIIVVHDHPETTHMFEAIIKGFLDKGISFQKYI